ncbi:hypothetical protein R70006_05044 [Paraburkholderia domus]|uniref:hypothetical protein n=1 Tax=Paraburkholderia domus TaxID=2793075 RepID=UPI0019139F0D|nr:hypothetical protein [Paraburkholderia domus]MBK5051720.1 hypothetical protein [Burkholderia sp. R-70006]CAE6795298.1 hypothetical protein R70006_05044 [Paraburkholderia domus]
MNQPPAAVRIDREEILASLLSLGDDPTAAMVNELHARIDASALPAGERVDVVIGAVDAARAGLDAASLTFRSMTVYHVTPQPNLTAILREGLVPRRGERSLDCGEQQDAVFCFPTREACDTGMGGWLGDAFNDCPENGLAVIEIELPAGMRTRSDVEYELAVLDPIPPSAVTRIFDENWQVLKMPVERELASPLGIGATEQVGICSPPLPTVSVEVQVNEDGTDIADRDSDTVVLVRDHGGSVLGLIYGNRSEDIFEVSVSQLNDQARGKGFYRSALIALSRQFTVISDTQLSRAAHNAYRAVGARERRDGRLELRRVASEQTEKPANNLSLNLSNEPTC